MAIDSSERPLEALPGPQVGARFGPTVHVVSPDENEQILFAVGDYNPCYLPSKGGTPGLVHPAFLLRLNVRELATYRPTPTSVGVHARDEVRFYRPIRVNEPFAVTWTVERFYEKKGKPYWVRRMVITNEAGETCMTRLMHVAFVNQAPD